MSRTATPRRKFLVPEVIQTSSIDCGPACLKSAFAGYGIDISYDALRDACQTDADGTSLDSLETVANQLGLVAEQVWVPVDHLTITEVSPLPAIFVTQLPGGPAHFVLAWRHAGGRFQLMDPNSGRRWVSGEQLRGLNFPYQLELDADFWRTWAETAEFDQAMRYRLREIAGDETLLDDAKRYPSPIPLACLDAAMRMTMDLVRVAAIKVGAESRELVASLFRGAIGDIHDGAPGRTVPEEFYSALPLGPEAKQVRLSGAILLRFRGPRIEAGRAATQSGLHAETAARIRARPTMRPWRDALRVLRRDGLLTPTMAASAVAVAAFFALLEVLLLRALLDIGDRLQGPLQRWAFLGLFLGMAIAVTAIEVWKAVAVRSMGRRFELRMRVDFLCKVPRLSDVYFRSRPASDMAHRAHLFHSVRSLPDLCERLTRITATLLVTTIGLIWLDPAGWPLVVAVGCISLAMPWIGQGRLKDCDLKVRVHDSRLAQFKLDALLGLMPIRAHGAERAVRWEHASIVLEWIRARKQRLAISVSVQVVQTVVSTGVAIALVVSYILRSGDQGGALLITYWALSMPLLGQQMASVTRRLPQVHSLLSRLLEPIQSEATVDDSTPPQLEATQRDEIDAPRAPSLVFDRVEVSAGGNKILERLDLSIAPGEHVAIVGPSGAGKSTLLSLLLGWTTPESGQLRVNGAPIQVTELRGQMAWLDPAVALWGRSMLENLSYGSEDRAGALLPILKQAELIEVLERLPEGMQSNLGEGGRLVSGGEGQRVRLGRAMTRANAGLVLLDEPFRGLERPLRARLLARSRQLWARSTLLCVTHDINVVADFDRVVVIDDGMIIEDGSPRALVERDGRFRELLVAEARVHSSGWNDPSWKRLVMRNGSVERGDEVQ